jgi:hypothetical protein
MHQPWAKPDFVVPPGHTGTANGLNVEMSKLQSVPLYFFNPRRRRGNRDGLLTKISSTRLQAQYSSTAVPQFREFRDSANS